MSSGSVLKIQKDGDGPDLWDTQAPCAYGRPGQNDPSAPVSAFGLGAVKRPSGRGALFHVLRAGVIFNAPVFLRPPRPSKKNLPFAEKGPCQGHVAAYNRCGFKGRRLVCGKG